MFSPCFRMQKHLFARWHSPHPSPSLFPFYRAAAAEVPRSPGQPPGPVSSTLPPQARAEPPVRDRPAPLSQPPGRRRASSHLSRHGGAGRPRPGPPFHALHRHRPPPHPWEQVRRGRVRAAAAPLGCRGCRLPQAGGTGRCPAGREGAVRRGRACLGPGPRPRARPWGGGAAVGEAGVAGPGQWGERGAGARSVVSASAPFPAPFPVAPTVPGLWAWRCSRGRVGAYSRCFIVAGGELQGRTGTPGLWKCSPCCSRSEVSMSAGGGDIIKVNVKPM